MKLDRITGNMNHLKYTLGLPFSIDHTATLDCSIENPVRYPSDDREDVAITFRCLMITSRSRDKPQLLTVSRQPAVQVGASIPNTGLHINYMRQGERSANCRKVERLDK